jgi:hypothetical protein
VNAAEAADCGETAQRPRLILLGASNLTRGFSVVLQTARQVWGASVEIMGAMGRGRSYGQSTVLLGRALPGILHSGLWPAIERRGPAPSAALVTDIGNDILYEVPVERLIGWITECFDRLAECGAATVVTQLPVENLKNLSPRRFLFYRRLFVPSCRLDQAEITARVLDVNEQVVRMARERGLSIVAQDARWYGMDPIHIEMRSWGAAWQTILAPWNSERARVQSAVRASLLRVARCALFFPENAAYFGVARRVRQPCARLRDGTTISLY